MTRLELRPVASLDPAQRQLYDTIAHGARARGVQHFDLVDADGRLAGPFDVMIRAPRVGAPLQALGAAIRYDSALPSTIREAAILQVARWCGSSFEWAAHEPMAREAGLGDVEIAGLRTGRADVFPAGPIADAHRVVTALLGERRQLDEPTYAAVVASLGVPLLVELVVLVGYYRLLADAMRLFAIDVDPPADPSAPPVQPEETTRVQ